MMQGTMPGARRRGRPCTAWMNYIKTWTGLSVEESIRMTGQGQMEKVRPWCGQPSDRGRLAGILFIEGVKGNGIGTQCWEYECTQLWCRHLVNVFI